MGKTTITIPCAGGPLDGQRFEVELFLGLGDKASPDAILQAVSEMTSVEIYSAIEDQAPAGYELAVFDIPGDGKRVALLTPDYFLALKKLMKMTPADDEADE